MSPQPRLPRFLSAGLAAACCIVVLTSCDGGSDRNAPAGAGGAQFAPLTISCSLSSSPVLVGGSPVLVMGRVTRGGVPVSGAMVDFAATRGSLDPTSTWTDAEGMAVALYAPPATPGAARVDLIVTDPRFSDSSTGACSFDVVQARNPRLSVGVVVPAQAAGLEIRVQYDPSRVDLPAGAAVPVGVLASGACLPLVNDNGTGFVQMNVACSSLQGPIGTAAQFDFVRLSGAELTTADFTVSCSSFDELGRPLATSCTTAVTQL